MRSIKTTCGRQQVYRLLQQGILGVGVTGTVTGDFVMDQGLCTGTGVQRVPGVLPSKLIATVETADTNRSLSALRIDDQSLFDGRFIFSRRARTFSRYASAFDLSLFQVHLLAFGT